MGWLFLVVAGALEVGWAAGLKYSDGFSRVMPLAFSALGMLASVSLLGLAARTIPIGTAYAVWTGIGIVGTTVFGGIAWNESFDLMRLICIGLIIAGAIGLKLGAH